MRLTSPFPYVDRVDVRLFRRIATNHSPALDETLPRLSRAANKSGLWVAIAGLLGLLGGRFGRRAAARGLLSIAITSPIANLFGKLLTRRPRPLIDDVPLARRLARLPKSSSFPSGHSASAVAFATGASVELPYLVAPLAPLSAAVAYSRIYTGVHYPSDVVAGAALGASVALATRSFWPVVPSEPVEAHHLTRVDIDARPRGAGVTVVVNEAAGSALAGSVTQALRRSLPEAHVDQIELTDGHELDEALQAAIERGEVIGISGGDGSINAAAQVAIDHKRPLMIVPGGTLNHLARDIGVNETDEAVQALQNGDAIAVDVATIDGKPFLNTASAGAYTELVDAREKLESKIGKWPAVVVALLRVLRHGEPIDVEIDGDARKIWMIFIGNCRYHPSGFAPAWRERLDDGRLDVRLVDASSPWARTRLILSVLTGRLGRSRIYEQRIATDLKIVSLQGPLRLARDGETFDGSQELTVEKLAEPLVVYAPTGATRDSIRLHRPLCSRR